MSHLIWTLFANSILIFGASNVKSMYIHVFATLNPIALRRAKIVCNFGLSECNRVKKNGVIPNVFLYFLPPKNLQMMRI